MKGYQAGTKSLRNSLVFLKLRRDDNTVSFFPQYREGGLFLNAAHFTDIYLTRGAECGLKEMEVPGMEKRKDVIRQAMAEFLDIPKDLVLDLPKVTIVGRNELYIENHRGIIEYSLDRLRINLSRGFLEIEGSGLEIRALMADEMKISGEVRAIKYLD
jgi:sporulation protein YqfC